MDYFSKTYKHNIHMKHTHEVLTQSNINTSTRTRTKKTHKNMYHTPKFYDGHVMTYNFMYSFEHTFSFYTYKQ
jgi:hypothetical protein